MMNHTYDNADRPSTATDSANGITYASGTCGVSGTGVCYAPQGALSSAKIGVSSVFTGGLVLTNTYNSRLQPLELKASSSGGNAMDLTYNFNLGTGNNGRVFGIANNIDSTRSQTFTYDALNRIASALTTSTHATSPAHCWGEVYGIDAWSNLQSISATSNPAYVGCLQESGFSKTADVSNHLAGFSYDTSGNTSNDGVNAYVWNAESQLTSGGGVTYLYDGDGRRVAKVGSKLYWYGSGGEIFAETDASGNNPNEYVFFGGKRVALLPSGSTAQFYAEDFLGSSRIVTTNTGVVCYDADFYPFGGERGVTSSCPQNNYKFEGKERDTETGNDDFGARYYSNRFGRWLSADWSIVPVAVPYANLTNPQTLNLYAMVSDDPESFADLDGHCDPVNICSSDIDSVTKGIDKALTNLVFGLVNASTKTFDFKVPDLPLQTADNAAEQKGMIGTTIAATVLPIADATIAAVEARSASAATEAAAGEKTYQTYTKPNPESGEVYSGKTSGTRTPEENVAARDADHHMNEKGFKPATLDKSSSNPNAIRGREQQLIKKHGGAKSQGGTSGNAINGVSPRNPNAGAYEQAAKKEFGDL